MNKSDKQRVFFALNPEKQVRDQIAATAAELARNGRAVKTENFHITLLFIGEVPQPAINEMITAAAGIRLPPFNLTLDQFGCFKRSRVSWLGVSRMPGTLRELHLQLKTALEIYHIKTENRDYRPHLTLARNVRRTVPEHSLEASRHIDWQVSAFELMASVNSSSGIRYDTLKKFALLTHDG